MFPIVEPLSASPAAALWAWVGIVAVTGVAFGGLCAQMAFRKGRSPGRCPGCGHPNHPAARRRLGCGGALTPSADSEAAAAQAV